MRKRITSALLTLVMLLSLVPAVGTTAAAAETKAHPENVNSLGNGEYKLCYYTDKLDSYGSRKYEKVSTSEFTSKTSGDEIWQAFTTTYAKNGVVGWIYYIQETGTLYIKGTISEILFLSEADAENVLKVIVDGDTTIERSIYGYDGSLGRIAPGLKEMTIDFRNGSILTLRANTSPKKKALLDITKTEGNAVRSYGDLKLTGDGTLKIAPADYSPNVMFGIRANNISVLDNVSLDIKMGSRYDLMNPVSAAAITCEGKLNIDTTGTVEIDVSKKIDPSAKDERGYFKVFSNINNTTFNLTCAKSVTLKAREKNDTFVAYYDYVTGGENWHSTIMTALEKNGWKISESADTAKPFYSVTMTPQAELKNLKLNVGGTSHPASEKNFDYVMGSDNKLSVSFDAGPQWFTTCYLKNKINLNARVYIWKDGTFLSDFNIAQMTGGRTDGTLGFTLDVRNLNLEAGHTYRVYASVSPTMNGDYLAESPLTAQWTFKTVNAPVLKEITAVGLMQNFYLYPTDSGVSNPDIKISGNSQPYEITNAGEWTADSSNPETYTRTVTLTPKAGYKFTSDTKVTAVNADGAKPVDGVSKTLNTENGTLSVTITTYKRYTVKFLNADGTSTGNAAQYIRKEYKATAPDWEAVPSGKVFVGWKQDLSDSSTEEVLLPGNQTAKITENTTYYAVLEDAPTYGITLSKLLVEPKVAAGEEATFHLTITNTGADTGSLTVFFKMNSGDHFKFTNDVEDSETHENITGASLNTGATELTIPSIAAGKSVNIKLELPDTTPVGDYGCAVQVKSTDSSSTLKSNAVLVKTTVAKQVTVNLYRNETQKSWLHDVPFVGDVVNLTAVDQDENTGMGPLGAHETFVGWTANKSDIVFEDPTAVTTKFVMPDIDVSSEELTIKANFVTAAVNGIAITKMPTKTEYEAGEVFDPTGIEVKLTYSDGTMEALPNNATLTYDPNTSLTVGTTSVKVSYTDGTNTWDTYLPITVKVQNAATYTVTYNANGGSGTMLSETATQGVSFILPHCIFTPPAGKAFDKWQIGSTDYQPGQSVSITDNTTVTAIWQEIPAGAVKVDPPTAAGPFTYDGSEKTGVATGSGYGLTGTDKAINAGTYTAIASLNDSGSYWQDGTQQPKLIEWTINPANRDGKPGAPEMASRTTDSITLKAITAAGETVEYSMDGSYWQSSTTFTGLSSGTGYTFYARYAAKANYNPSAASDGATFFTLSGGSSSGSTAYTVTVLGSKNGTVTADRKTASAGSTVSLTVSPDKGYTLETLTVLDKSGKEIKLTEKNGKYTFTMPASNVEVKAAFMDDNTMLNFFVDVKAGDYFYDAVLWAAEKGITGGTDATHFSPNGVCTRAQAVTFLWRAAGSPAPKSTAMPFTDVPAGSYYEQAVLWAVENGITKGTGDTTFSPNATCSRAQIVTFLWRSQKSPAAGSVNPFTDVSADAYYADAVLWAVKESVTSGTTATTFSPNADCTRAQIVTFIYRALAE